MKKKIMSNFRKGQSTLEYAFVITVTVGALLVMIIYLSRSLQGMLKYHTSSMGGEKLTATQYSPGPWYGSGDSSNVTRSSRSGFDFEWGIGQSFAIYTGSAQTNSVGSVTGAFSSYYLPDPEEGFGALPQGEDQALVNEIAGSYYDPGMDLLRENLNSQNPEWSHGYTEDETDGETGEYDPNTEEGIIDRYTDEHDPNAPSELSEDELQDLHDEQEAAREQEMGGYL